MGSLLDKSRQINRLLQKSAGYPVNFGEVAQILSKNLNSNVYLLDESGKILGSDFMPGFECEMVSRIVKEANFPQEYNDWLLQIGNTYANFCQTGNSCVFASGKNCHYSGKVTTVVPIVGAGKRLGTLVAAKFNQEFTEEDLVLAELGATVVGMEILRERVDKMEEDARRRAAVQVALGTLSYSELDAVRHIFEQLDGEEGLLVASKIADRVGITRSVIVNALRKFESAGVIESKSLGMKGTYIRVLNDRLLEELRKLKHN